jgi:hypothetical protein
MPIRAHPRNAAAPMAGSVEGYSSSNDSRFVSVIVPSPYS